MINYQNFKIFNYADPYKELAINREKMNQDINKSRGIKSEEELIALAQNHPDDNVAKEAMKELRERFDKTYGWCEDCDGLVCKEKDCCLNNVLDNN